MSNHTYMELANVLPFHRFIQLQAQVTNPDCKKWVREISGVAVKKLTDTGRVLSIKYVPQDHGQYKDSGEISTPWLPDPVATMIGEAAKANIGKKMLFFQLNRGHSEDQPSGFREIVWIEELEPLPTDNQPHTPQESARPPARGRAPADVVADHFGPEPAVSNVAQHLNTPPPVEYVEEPF